MRIAIPMADGKLAVHFGHCRQFALIDADPDTAAVGRPAHLDAPPHEPGVLPKWLAHNGVDVVIAGGMGRRAIDLFAQHGIEVIVGAPSDDPETIARAYVNDTLTSGSNVCDH